MEINKDIRDILLKRLFITFVIMLVTRLCVFIPIPGVSHIELGFYVLNHEAERGLAELFYSGRLIVGIFFLNIIPYINASIFIQTLLAAFPQFSPLQQQGSLEETRKLNRLIRIFTLVWAFIQSLGAALFLKKVLISWDLLLGVEIMLWLTAGAMIALWFSELITDYGLGNGSSVLIFINILSNIPYFSNKILANTNGNFSLSLGLEVFTIIAISMYGMVTLQRGFRIIPLISSRELNEQLVSDSSSTPKNYIPLRLNQGGVMPIILAGTFLIYPRYIQQIGLNLGLPEIPLPTSPEFEVIKLCIYWVVYFLTIVVFSQVYARISTNSDTLARQLQKMAVSIPGVRTGPATSYYIEEVGDRIAAIGAIILATLTTFPTFIETTLNLTTLNGISTTSLLILTGVVIDVMREINNIYYSNAYNSML